jgi:hypothetical protein
LAGIALHVFGNRPDAGRHHAGRQQQAIAVEDAAAAGRHLERAGKAHFALALEEGVADHLHVGRARKQHDEGQRQHGDDELAAPHRRLGRQQRAGGVADVPHGRTPWLAEATGSATDEVTYSVMAGVTVRIAQLVLGQLLDAQRSGLGALFHFKAAVLDVEPARLGGGAVEFGEQAARVVLHAHQVQRGEHDGGQQNDGQPRHAGASVRSATRMTALRERGLAATSASPARTRPSARSKVGGGSANGARRSTTAANGGR